MPGIIEISDKKNGILSFDLAELMRLLPSSAQQLTWSVLDLSQFLEKQDELHAFGKELVAINEKAHSTKGGYILPWNDLVAYAEVIRQVVDGVFIGCKSVEALSTLNYESSNKDLYSAGEVVLEALDSSCWMVYSYDDEFLDRCRRTFQDVKEIATLF